VAELRGAGDEPGDDDTSARHLPADAGQGAGEARPRHEPSPRADYADVMRQATDKANAGQADADRAETDHSTEGSITDAVERFDPRRAGLPEVSREEAATYITEHQADRPWLAPARDCPPDVQCVIVALDQGHGHAHIRHEGWVTEEMNERRVRYLEDPAQLDPDKREAGIDGLAASDLPHWCGRIATRITNPNDFAIAFTHGVEHPDVRAALDSTGPRPEPVILPISEVLGEDGYKSCSGWQLEPVNGSMSAARANRDAWAAGDHNRPEPRAIRVETFEGGMVTFAFRRSAVGGYEISTMYVNPPNGQST
jgi:hypothetical protein